MKLQDITEMTMRAGHMDQHLNQFFKNIAKQKTEFKHVGDIENIQVLFKEQIYLLTKDATPLAFFQVYDEAPNAILKVAFVDAPFRKQGIFSKFIWFLKRNEGYKRIILGDVHSPDTIAAVDYISHRFNVYWDNGKEQQPYQADIVDRFYSNFQPTEWRLVLENEGDFSSWPKFYNIADIHTWYEWILK